MSENAERQTDARPGPVPHDRQAPGEPWALIDRYARVEASRWVPSLRALPQVVDEDSLLALEVELSRRRKDSAHARLINALLIHFEVMQGRSDADEVALLAQTVSGYRPEPPPELISLLGGRRLCVLTGAGISTESGIPDYRGPTAPPRKRAPIQHRDFMEDPRTRARYWARSMLGWPRFRDFEPNDAHRALARWPQVHGLVTQNVDRLHQKAGHAGVVELHGALADVRCLSCPAVVHRDDLQARLEAMNPQALGWKYTLFADGDADLPDALIADFQVPACACGGVLKPDVVFFGDSVPRPRLDHAFSRLDDAEVLLVVGSSLTVFSGYRFVLRAKDQQKPVVLINLGPTRADGDATLKVDARAGDVLPALVDQLSWAKK